MTFHLLFYHPRISILLTGAVAALFSCCLSAAPFTVYDHVLFQGRPDLNKYGMPRMEFARGGDMWPESAPKKHPTARCEPYEPGIRAEASKERGEDLLVIDLEEKCWNPRFATSDANFQERVQKYVRLVNLFHEEAPGTKVGFYAIMPPRNYPAAKSGDPQKLAEWRAHNAKMMSMGRAVDVVYPSLYTFENDPSAWVRYAELMIEEAKKYGNPVIPVIWPEYHPSAPAGTSGQPIDGQFWKLQLDTIKAAGADGVLLWSQAEPWNENAEWWKETKKFLASLDNSVPPVGSPGSLQFSSADYSVNEGASATITVTRTDGSDGVVSVDYTTADGSTATDGADYTFTRGSLSFANGNTTSKTFTVPTIDDADAEDVETVNLLLTNPDGGATLGARNTATLNIADNDSMSNGTCAGRTPTIFGTPGDDTIDGTADSDVIVGLGGNDVIRGKGGADIICGGAGDDKLYGGAGNDQLFGESGDDRLDGRDDFDRCDGGTHTSGDRTSECEQITNVP